MKKMIKYIKSSVSTLGAISIPVLLVLFSFLLEAIVFYCLWQWFIVPLGVKSITFLHAAGLSIFFNFVTFHYPELVYKRGEATPWRIMFFLLVRPIIVIFLGAVIYFLGVE